jgi:hypothetical protein
MSASHVLLADAVTRSELDFARIEYPSDWILPLAALAVISALVLYMYRLDSVELRRGVAWLLTGLRLIAFVGLLLVYLQPQWRNESDTVHNSRVVLAVDTSLSMGLTDNDHDGSSDPQERSRLENVVAALDNGRLIDQLREKHDTVVVRFDQQADRVATLAKTSAPASPRTATTAEVPRVSDTARWLFYGGVASLALCVVCAACYLALRHWSWAVVALVGLVAAGGALGGLIARGEDIAWLDLMGLAKPTLTAPVLAGADEAANETENQPPADWYAALEPRGLETRLGEAIRQIVLDEGAAPLAGIVVFSDGNQNAGLDPTAAVASAVEARVPIHAVGMGSPREPVNVRISDFVVPARAFPGDQYVATGYLQSQGMAGQTLTVNLSSREASDASAAAGVATLEASEEVILGEDGEVIGVKFELTPEEIGRRTLRLEVEVPTSDRNQQDNAQEVDIEIVGRKTRVLLLAGGPSRDYTFLRNQLHRDRSMTVDVLLQSAQPGVSQDANEILDEFPTLREELFEYDCLVAFDPDWRALTSEQMELLEDWVAEQSGGMIVVPGPIYTDSWAQDSSAATVRDLYPVEFQRRFSPLDDGQFGSKEPWPIEFTRDGVDAEFLWLDDSSTASASAWREFAGVYGYYAVRGAKPAATIYGYYSDPRAAGTRGQPVYLAGHFYGSGRVFYLGSGEIWRLRADDEAYFERFYTKLIRHVSQGRLLRGSHRGVLLVERDRYVLGNPVVVRAQLTDAQLRPLAEPSVLLQVIAPDGLPQSITLAADAQREGAYQGQFTARQEGAYRLQLELPDSDEEILSRRIQVRIPDLEREQARRNDALLYAVADATGGRYYKGAAEALQASPGERLTDQLRDRSRTVTLPAAPNKLWDNWWVLGGLCGVLCLEWLVRRLSRLA